MISQAVIGCGFGDEGKGKVVSSLCPQAVNPLVIRFSGGQQAGHHVVLEDGTDHVFSNFGSGTLQGFDSYWSRFCTIDPVGILNELDVLKSKGIDPVLYIDSRCPVTTPYEKHHNRIVDNKTKHGSCGVGVGQTYQREQDHYSLLFSDLFLSSALEIKVALLKKYYSDTLGTEIEDFIESCNELIGSNNIILVDNVPYDCYDRYIFEGSQGLLLDQNIGFFPHVTRGNTGSQNILELGHEPEIFLVTRAYQTRHGNGPMTNKNFPHKIKPNSFEQNPDDNFQGKFNISILDLDLLKYAINRDQYIKHKKNKTLIVTCLDLIEEYSLTSDRTLYIFEKETDFIDKIKEYLKIKNIFISKNPYSYVE